MFQRPNMHMNPNDVTPSGSSGGAPQPASCGRCCSIVPPPSCCVSPVIVPSSLVPETPRPVEHTRALRQRPLLHEAPAVLAAMALPHLPTPPPLAMQAPHPEGPPSRQRHRPALDDRGVISHWAAWSPPSTTWSFCFGLGRMWAPSSAPTETPDRQKFLTHQNAT